MLTSSRQEAIKHVFCTFPPTFCQLQKVRSLKRSKFSALIQTLQTSHSFVYIHSACLNHTKTSQLNRVGLTGGLCHFEQRLLKDIQHSRKFRTDSSSVEYVEYKYLEYKLWMIFNKIIELPKTYFLREF